jgi:hypothetical protein
VNIAKIGLGPKGSIHLKSLTSVRIDLDATCDLESSSLESQVKTTSSSKEREDFHDVLPDVAEPLALLETMTLG